MSDGQVKIDVMLDTSTLQSDTQKLNHILSTIGSGTGDKMDADFKSNTQSVENTAKRAHDSIKRTFDDDIIQNIKSDTKKAEDNVNKFKRDVEEIPEEKTTNFNANDHITEKVKSARGEVQKATSDFRTLKSAIVGSFIGVGISSGMNVITSKLHEMVDAGAEFNAEQDTMRTVWHALTTHAPQDGQNLIDYINKMSQSSIYSAETINEMAQSFYHVHSNAKETVGWINDFVNLGSTMHLTNAQMAEAGQVWGRIVAGGRVGAEDLNMMIDRFPMFAEALEQSTGKSMEQIRDLSQKGKLYASDFEGALDDLGKKYQAGREEAMTSAMGMQMYLQSRFSALFGRIEDGVFKTHKSTLSAIINLTNDKHINRWADEISDEIAKVTDRFIAFAKWTARNKDEVMLFIKAIGLLAGAIVALKIIKTAVGFFTDLYNITRTTGGAFVNFGRRLFGMETQSSRAKSQVDKLTASVERLNRALAENETLGDIDVGGGGGTSGGSSKRSSKRAVKGAAKASEEIADDVARYSGKSRGILKGLGKAGMAIPFLDVLLSSSELIGMTKETAGSHIGGFAGSLGGGLLGGAAAGAAAGSVVPGVGTAVGTVVGAGVGSLAGSHYGKEFGAWAQKEFSRTFKPHSVKTQFNGLDSSVKHAAKQYDTLREKIDTTYAKIAATNGKYNKSQFTENQKLYNSMVKNGEKYLNSQHEQSKKRLDILVKEGYLTKAEAKRAEETDKITNKDKENNLRSSVNNLKKINSKYYSDLNKLNRSENADLEQALKGHYTKSGKLTKDGERIKEEIEESYQEKRKKLADQFHKDRERSEKKTAKAMAETLSDSAQQQKIILGKLRDSAGKISAQQASSIIKQSAKQRDKTIDNANETYKKAKDAADKKYKSVMSAADKEYYVTGTISESQYKEIKKKAEDTRDKAVNAAKEQRDKTISHAREMHDGVVKEARSQAKSHLSAVDEETGDTLDSWDKFKVGLAATVNSIAAGINGIIKAVTAGHVKHLIPEWHPKGYSHYIHSHASGTGNAPGGRSLVGEAGPELAYEPYSNRVRLLGINGPEITHVKPGEHILNAIETSKLMAGGLGKGVTLPGYANGRGLLGTTKSMIENAFYKLTSIPKSVESWLENPAKHVLSLFTGKKTGTNILAASKIEGGVLSAFKDGAKDLMKDLLGDLFSANPSGTGVNRWRGAAMKALQMNGLSESLIGKVMRQIATESGGDPLARQRVIDVNTFNGSGGAMGLLQTIPSTFNAFKFPGHGNIFNGFDNLLAALNYAKHRYGKNLNGLGEGHGYVDGGKISKPTFSLLGEAPGEDEYVINPSRTSPDLLLEAIEDMSMKQPDALFNAASSLVSKARSLKPSVNIPHLSGGRSGASGSSDGVLNVTVKVEPQTINTALDGKIIKQTVAKWKKIEDETRNLARGILGGGGGIS